MPTGYTADLHDGKDITFPDFAMQCARAFGALILMRDAPSDAAIPDEFPPDTSYYDEGLAKAEGRLAELSAMTPEQIMRANLDARAEVLLHRAKEAVRRGEIRRRYEAMLAEVDAWEPPTEEHAGLKKFMRDQLVESIKFDCAEIRYPEMPTEDPADWFDGEMAKAERDLAYHREKRQEEIGRALDRTAWVRALRASLATEDATS